VKTATLACAVAAAIAALALAAPSDAQPAPSSRPGSDNGSTDRGPAALSGPSSLLRHFGMNAAMRLMRSSDADERLRGIERASTAHTVEALSLLERAARPSGTGGVDPRLPDEGIGRRDPRALLAVVHGLADWIGSEGARSSLVEIVRAPNDGLSPRAGTTPNHDAATGDAESVERVKLAREEAAIALAGSGNPVALEALVAASRSGGAEEEAALVGLLVHPPSEPVVLGGVALTTPAMIAMAAKIGDLRALEAILGVMRATDPALRAAALSALAAAGDTRAADIAQGALHDEDARVRVAAAEVFARLGMPAAGPAVEALIGDDATAVDGLRIAQSVQGEGVVKAAAARAAASADPALRDDAIAVLGRQTAPSAVRALVALAADPRLQGDAVGALARSPSHAALEALQAMARIAAPGDPDAVAAPEPAAWRRLAARAYFVRRYERGERSERLDRLLGALAVSSDARDRAVGMMALVALGDRPVDVALSDPDAHVRRAGAMGSLGHWDASTARKLVAREALEPDEATRRVLAVGWSDPTSGDAVPTSVLTERAQAGGPDAPAAAFALARRFDETLATQIDAMLHASDAALRAATARGLGRSASAEASGRLSLAYEWEADAGVRRAIVSALTIRAAEGAAGAQVGRDVLDLAARLDPDPVARWTAAGRSMGSSDPAGVRAVAWIRLVAAEGAAAGLDRTALLADRDGRALPIAFDGEGYALVPGVSPGEARLRLAPDASSYTAPAP
jgi:HEAT repeat protein